MQKTIANVYEIKSHLTFIETNINKLDVNLKSEFKRTHRANDECDGNEKTSMLYTLWSGIVDQIKECEN